MRVTLVVAMAENGVIGRDGDLPWRLSADLRRFRATTMGKPVLMGRRTWESLPRRPLDGRRNIVISRDPAYRAEGAEVAASLAGALALARAGGAEEACVIGGGEIYGQALPLADRLDVTHVLGEIDGDTYFPPLDPQMWHMVWQEELPASDTDTHAARRVIYGRGTPAKT